MKIWRGAFEASKKRRAEKEQNSCDVRFESVDKYSEGESAARCPNACRKKHMIKCQESNCGAAEESEEEVQGMHEDNVCGLLPQSAVRVGGRLEERLKRWRYHSQRKGVSTIRTSLVLLMLLLFKDDFLCLINRHT